MIPTYAFSDPNPVPILTRDPRLYPYHSFEGYENEASPRPWKVVTLENDHIEVFVLPEVGGKVWGARVKATGHEFIYRNEVMKFRNIALRGPWTSGGIEFNFGVIGHAPWTASPVDYLLRENPDGSVSCIVGTMDLPSRTRWRVEIRLPAESAFFETNTVWHNPTPVEQPYYNWMTAAAFATDDLELTIPGNAYLQHSGAPESWPEDKTGRFLPRYRDNDFGGNKSFHVVGELNDFFGGYYHDDHWGFGHWSRHEEMPGQKLWLWALSRSGGIWEELLTDSDGQYVEFQAGRLFVQYSPGSHINPISQAAFDPGATDRWTETWFPLEGIGGLTDASRDGALSIRAANGQLEIGVNAFSDVTDTLRVWSGADLILERGVELGALEPFATRVAISDDLPFRVELSALGLDYSSDPSVRELSRAFDADPAAWPSIPETDRLVFEGLELRKARRNEASRPYFEAAMALEPWHRGALLAMADLEYRSGRYEEGLRYAIRALRLDAYDAGANFAAGNLFRALGRVADARDAFGWAARAMAFRSAANVQLAELALIRRDLAEAKRYSEKALDYDRSNLSAMELLALVGRLTDDGPLAAQATRDLLAIDPLSHFARAEAFLANPTAAGAARWMAGIHNEFPDQIILELAIGYANRGLGDAAAVLLEAMGERIGNPLLGVWSAYLRHDADGLPEKVDPDFVFPFRRETLQVLRWAAEQNDLWVWDYLLALNLWAVGRAAEAGELLGPLGAAPDQAAFYVARAHFLETEGGDPEPDLRRAVSIDGGDRTLWFPLIRFYQQHERWNDALTASTRARAIFTDDFNLDLAHARSLIHLDRPLEALEILDTVHVLPSEHARGTHDLWVQAHTLAALDAMDADHDEAAYGHLAAALEWPESLGQGRPYEPEERLTRFLMGRIDQRLGRIDQAQMEFEAVVEETLASGPGLSRIDLLAFPAAEAAGSLTEVRPILLDRSSTPAANGEIWLFSELLFGLQASEIAELADAYPGEFDDLEGGLLTRALSISGP